MDLVKKFYVVSAKSGLPYYDSLGIAYYAYAIIFALFSLNILPIDLLMVAAVAIFAFSPLKSMSYIYIFSLPWMYVAKFSFGLTLSLIQSIVYLAKLILSKESIKLTRFEISYIFYLLLCGIINVLVYHSFTGMSMVLYFLISCNYAQKYIRDTSKCQQFWEITLYSVVLSCALATIYGLVNNTTLQRWVRGMGYANQLYGTLGTTRFGIYLCIGLLFGLFYLEKKSLKLVVLISLSIAILSTISVTAIVLMLSVYLIYFITNNDYKKIGAVLIVALMLLIVFLNWDIISNYSLIKPIALRMENIIQEAKMGDLGTATSGRTDLIDSYIGQYNNSPIIDRVFGSFNLVFDGVQYSHNSYFDMLMYCGIIGILLTIILQVKRLFDCRNNKCFKMYFMLKFIVLLPAATVSIFSAQFWQIWLFI